jgi:hypothetical protein
VNPATFPTRRAGSLAELQPANRVLDPALPIHRQHISLSFLERPTELDAHGLHERLELPALVQVVRHPPELIALA